MPASPQPERPTDPAAVEAQAENLSRSERELLKAIYRLSHNGDDSEAHTGDLAERLGLSPSTITTAVKRLADRDLVDHKPYKGVELTPVGNRLAVGSIRRHRIVERFLSDMLGYAWNEADRLAGAFEHELPQEVEDRLFLALDRPETCPHGFPIPAPEVVDIPTLPPLYALEAGDVAIVAVPGNTDPDVVAFLDQLGLRPGERVEIAEKHPFDGPLVLRLHGSEGPITRTLGAIVANQVYVQRVEHDTALDTTNDPANDTTNDTGNDPTNDTGNDPAEEPDASADAADPEDPGGEVDQASA